MKSLFFRYCLIKNLPGSEFDNFGRKLSFRFLLNGELDHFAKMLCNPVSIVRYFEFPFVHESADWELAGRCLDISSPRLLFVFLMKRYCNLHFDIVNPDADDLKETGKYLKTNKLDARAAVHNIDATERLPFPDQYFDTITSVSVFEHIPDDGDGIALQQAWRTLKPGGRLVLTLPCAQEYCEEFRPEDVYGLNKGTWKKEYFFQRVYSQSSIDGRLSAAINVKPLFSRIYGEKNYGFYRSYEARWMQHGLKETVKDPYYISRHFSEFQSIDKMPGLGICGLIFKKESGNV